MYDGIFEDSGIAWYQRIPPLAIFGVFVFGLVFYFLWTTYHNDLKGMWPLIPLAILVLWLIASNHESDLVPLKEWEARDVLYHELTHRLDLLERKYRMRLLDGNYKDGVIHQGLSCRHGTNTTDGFYPYEWWIGFRIDKSGQPTKFFKAKVDYWKDRQGLVGIEQIDKEFDGREPNEKIKPVPISEYDKFESYYTGVQKKKH